MDQHGSHRARPRVREGQTPPPGRDRFRLGRGFPRRHLVARLLLVLAAVLVIGALVSLWLVHRQVSDLRRFASSAPGWVYPSRVYSDWIDLDPRRDLPRGYVEASLEARRYELARLPLSEPGTYAATGGNLEVYLRGFPYPEGVSRAARARLRFAGGRLAGVDVEPGGPAAPRIEPVLLRVYSSPEHPVERTYVRLEDVPPVLRAAIVAAEDRRFFRHLGLDLRGTGRAFFHNLRGREGMQGGSTITQQLARNLFLSRRRTLGRKLQEVLLALTLERMLSKRDILEMYLNSVYFGNAGPVEIGGVAEASRYFFDKSVRELSLSEAALLAGIIPAPNLYSPFRNPRLARRRRDLVLADMAESGWLSSRLAARVRAQPLRFRRGRARPVLFPYFTDYAISDLGKHVDAEALTARGLRVFTTLDPLWQERTDAQMVSGITAVERWYGRRGPDPLEGAACLLEPGTGFVRALVGGRDYRRSPFNRATQSVRQPGSAFKPLVYAVAFDRFWRDPSFTAATTFPDLPREFVTPEGPWRPRNDDGSYRPRVTVAKALAKSINVATANLTERVGPRVVAQYALRLGIRGVRPVPSIGLGTSEVSLVTLSAMYATIQNDGMRVEPHPVRVATAADGRVLYRAERSRERVFQSMPAQLTVQLLRDVVDFGTAYTLKSVAGFARPTAGKTGTTDEYRDAWFVGFTPQLLCGVWLGYDRPTPMGTTAADTAVPVWGDVMSSVLAEFPAQPFPEPPGIEFATIDSYSGGLATPWCPSRIRAAFVRGTAPRAPCTVDHSAEWMPGLELAPPEDSLSQEPLEEPAGPPRNLSEP